MVPNVAWRGFIYVIDCKTNVLSIVVAQPALLDTLVNTDIDVTLHMITIVGGCVAPLL